jgi:uncharacterized membrane protein YfcA
VGAITAQKASDKSRILRGDDMTKDLLLMVLGVFAGTLSGLIGIGGGVVIVPALIFLFGYSQHNAQGTTLALMVPPIGLAAALVYFRQGYVNVEAAILICIGFLAGGYFGAHLANHMSNVALERIFGVAMVLIGVKMLLAR